MKKTGRLIPMLAWFVIGLLVMSLAAGCAAPAPSAKAGQIRVEGALDVLPLANAAQADFEKASGYKLSIQPSAQAVADLKKDRIDIAIVGKDLDPAELEGLQDHAVAYDAVCLLVSTRVYNGGMQITHTDFGKGPVVKPLSKYSGLTNVTQNEIRQLYQNMLGHPASAGLNMPLPAPYFEFQPYTQDILDPQTPLKEDPDQPGVVLGTWVWTDYNLALTIYPQGKFDTQDALFQKLNLDSADLRSPKVAVISPIIDSEEVLISFQFQIDPGEEKPESTRLFSFVGLTASRQVALRAIQHGFRLKALSIDGVDPLADPQAIYNGSYPFNRQIHILTKKDSRVEDQALVDFLLSAQGQALIQKASFLPLPSGN